MITSTKALLLCYLKGRLSALHMNILEQQRSGTLRNIT